MFNKKTKKKKRFGWVGACQKLHLLVIFLFFSCRVFGLFEIVSCWTILHDILNIFLQFFFFNPFPVKYWVFTRFFSFFILLLLCWPLPRISFYINIHKVLVVWKLLKLINTCPLIWKAFFVEIPSLPTEDNFRGTSGLDIDLRVVDINQVRYNLAPKSTLAVGQ